MKPTFDTVTIVGVGLLGGSLGLALKARGMAGHIRGVGHRQSSLDKALNVGAIDTAFLDLQEALQTTQLVIVCTPAALVQSVLDEVVATCSPDVMATDVASTKGLICEHAHATWPRPRRFVGSHPMAGSEKSGPEHASPGFYEGSVTLIEQPSPDVDTEAHAQIKAMWQHLGANVIEIDGAQHDAMLARTSHVPHVLAGCVAKVAVERDQDVRPYAGGGFRDVTRIAASRPEVWRDICLTNRDAILDALDETLRTLNDFRSALDQRSEADVTRFFAEARDARRKVIDE